MSRGAHLFLREVAILIVRLALLVGAVLVGVAVGSTVFLGMVAVGRDDVARFLGVLAGVTAFLAGHAGMEHVLAQLRAFLDPGPEDGGLE